MTVAGFVGLTGRVEPESEFRVRAHWVFGMVFASARTLGGISCGFEAQARVRDLCLDPVFRASTSGRLHAFRSYDRPGSPFRSKVRSFGVREWLRG